MERRLHGPRQHNYNRRRRIADHGESLPEHEGCREYERKVQHLCGELPGLHASDAEHGCDLCGVEGELGITMRLEDTSGVATAVEVGEYTAIV